MSFLDSPRFPDNVAFGATGGPGYLTDVVFLNSGAESRNQTWAQARCSYEVSHAARLPAEYVPLRDFFRAVKGRTHGFRFKDWADYSCTAATGVLASGVGTGYPTMQLGKRYAAGALSEVRGISKPTGTIAIYRNAVLATSGSGDGQYALDATTGVVTWVKDATQTISSFTVGANTVLTLAAPLTGAATGKYVYLASVSGTAAATLNTYAWEIADVTGSDITIAAVTTGLTATTGVAYMYPQASDALTWAGEFDVPCRFDTDRMAATAINKSGGQLVIDWDSIPVVEIRV